MNTDKLTASEAPEIEQEQYIYTGMASEVPAKMKTCTSYGMLPSGEAFKAPTFTELEINFVKKALEMASGKAIDKTKHDSNGY